VKKTRAPKSVFHRSEYEEQVAVFEWAKMNEHLYPCLELLFGSLMGVHLSPKLLNKVTKAGMKKGKPDINLPVSRGGFHGLWIELKIPGNGLSPDQEKMCRHLAAEGNAVYKCVGAASTTRIIEAYVKGEIKATMKLDPIFHGHEADGLPIYHPMAFDSQYCHDCKSMVHAFNNECMQPWFELDRKTVVCLDCFLKEK
jgi:hypothetical protein